MGVWEDLSISWTIINEKKDLPPEKTLFWAYLKGRAEQILHGDYCGQFINDNRIILMIREPDCNENIECVSLDNVEQFHWFNEELRRGPDQVIAWLYYHELQCPKKDQHEMA